VHSGAAGPQTLLLGESVTQTDAAVAGLVPSSRKLLHHYGGVGVDRREGPAALLHCRGRDATQQYAATGGDLDVLRQLGELYLG